MSAADDPTPTPDEDGREPAREPASQGPVGRTRARVFIVVVVLAQLLVPLTYYLRDDPYDERFAWRMFSGVRLQECQSRVLESRGGREEAVSPYQVVPAGWVSNLERNRRPVMERYLARRCEVEGMTSVRIENRCREVSGGEPRVVQLTRDCATGEQTP